MACSIFSLILGLSPSEGNSVEIDRNRIYNRENTLQAIIFIVRD